MHEVHGEAVGGATGGGMSRPARRPCTHQRQTTAAAAAAKALPPQPLGCSLRQRHFCWLACLFTAGPEFPVWSYAYSKPCDKARRSQRSACLGLSRPVWRATRREISLKGETGGALATTATTAATGTGTGFNVNIFFLKWTHSCWLTASQVQHAAGATGSVVHHCHLTAEEGYNTETRGVDVGAVT